MVNNILNSENFCQNKFLQIALSKPFHNYLFFYGQEFAKYSYWLKAVLLQFTTHFRISSVTHLIIRKFKLNAGSLKPEYHATFRIVF